MLYLSWTLFTASDIATCIMAMLRLQGLPTTLAIFMAPIAVWFQSVITSALAGDVKASAKERLVAAIAFAIANKGVLMGHPLIMSDERERERPRESEQLGRCNETAKTLKNELAQASQ
jgi:hypothetical protein